MAKLSPVYVDAQFILGIPANGAQLFTYQAGSSTPLATYTDSSGITAQSNPIILNARGEPASPIWLAEGLAYKFVFTSADDTDPPSSPIRTIDNVTGVGDNTIVFSQWQDTGVVPTYVNPTTFTVPGDQTSTFSVGRRVQAFTTAGTVYGYITSSVFTTLTTVQVVLDSGTLDAGLSTVKLGLLTPDNNSIPLLTDNYPIVANAADPSKKIRFDLSLITTALTRVFTWPNKDGTVAMLDDITTAIANIKFTGTRQTVSSGPVNTDGTPNFGGLTGATTVTATGTLIVTAANGFTASGNVDRIGSISNPSWTGLNINGQMPLYLDVNADGTCTPTTSSLMPNYRQAGADVVTNGQFTFNIAEMVGKLGNGSVANQIYRVTVGEVTVAGGVVTAIVWYALNGRYVSTLQAVPALGTPVPLNHNIGVQPNKWMPVLYCATTEAGYSVADEIDLPGIKAASPFYSAFQSSINRLLFSTVVNTGIGSYNVWAKSNGNPTVITIANWRIKLYADRGW